jgi:hypothetical protein
MSSYLCRKISKEAGRITCVSRKVEQSPIDEVQAAQYVIGLRF